MFATIRCIIGVEFGNNPVSH